MPRGPNREYSRKIQVKDIGKSTFSAKVSCPLSSARTQVQAAWAVRQEWEDCSTCWLKRQVRTRLALFRTRGPLPSSHWPTPPPTPPTSLRQPARHRQTLQPAAWHPNNNWPWAARYAGLRWRSSASEGEGWGCTVSALVCCSRAGDDILTWQLTATSQALLLVARFTATLMADPLPENQGRPTLLLKGYLSTKSILGECMTQINLRLLSWTIMKR